MLSQQLEAGQVDEQVREQVAALEHQARELRHDIACTFDPRRCQERERSAEPSGGEHRSTVYWEALAHLPERRITDVRVDDPDGGAREVAQRDPELDQEWWHGHVVTRRDESDHSKVFRADFADDPRARRPDFSQALAIDFDPELVDQLAIDDGGALCHGLQGGSLARYAVSVWSIVHLLSSFGVGGQERVALDLALGQKARGHRVSVLSLAPEPDGAMAREFQQGGITVGRVPKRGGLDPTLVPRLAHQLRKHRADVVHTHNPLPLIYGAPAARLIGAAAIHTKHGINPGSRAHRALRRVAAQLTHAFVAVSDTTAAQARALHDVSPGKLHTIPNGIRLDRYAPDPEARAATRVELGLGDAWVVGTVGRLDAYKNQALLVRAIAPLLSSSVRLVIVGDGDNRGEVEAAVAALPEPRWVVMTGRRMDVPRLIHAFDVFALSSKTEGLPLVVPEAMAAGLPIVTTSVGGLPGVVDHGQTGLLVPVDEAALAAALAKLASDRELAQAMGRRAREVALERYSHDRMVEAYLELYASARNGSPS